MVLCYHVTMSQLTCPQCGYLVGNMTRLPARDEAIPAIDQAHVAEFLTARTRHDEHARISAATLYDAYVDWRSPDSPLTRKAFGMVLMRQAGLGRTRSKRERLYVGVELV